MQSVELAIRNKLGLHARPAGQLAELAGQFDSTLTIDKGGKQANARSILSILMLEVQAGDVITISAEGPDEQDAIEALRVFITTCTTEAD